MSVETEVNGDSKGTNERVLSCLVCWACGAGARAFCSALAATRKRKSKREPRKVFLLAGRGGTGLIPTKAHERSFLSVIL